jgi:hypothetical protein
MAVRFGCGPNGMVTPFRISVITYDGDRGYHSIDAYIGHLRQFFAQNRLWLADWASVCPKLLLNRHNRIPLGGGPPALAAGADFKYVASDQIGVAPGQARRRNLHHTRGPNPM